MSTTASPARRPDLDLLRAGAMLLGIVLHASLSFFPGLWLVNDTRQNGFYAVLFSAIHGFRMPLFFVMCGYFSAMLLRHRGTGSLVKHRFRRVFLPLLVGLATVVPLTNWISGVAMKGAKSAPVSSPGNSGPAGTLSLWQAAQAGDLEAIDQNLASGVDVNAPDPREGGAALLWAAVRGRTEAVERLIDRGANVNETDRSGSTALMAAAFLGYDAVVDVLIRRGANVNQANARGETPLNGAQISADDTRTYAPMMGLEANAGDLAASKQRIADALTAHGGVLGRQSSIADVLMALPVFNHLWFLWFLWWLVLGYAGLMMLGSLLPRLRLPGWLVLSPARYLWLVPLTMVPQWLMGEGGTVPIFGPDTSAGILPIPHVLAYYAIFFGFGALYFDHEDRTGRVGRHWWIPLGLALAVVFPLGLAFVNGWGGPAAWKLDSTAVHLASTFLAAAYAWLMTFGLMGLVRSVCPTESPRMRYLSDSAYWLYLAHLPLIIGAQYLVRDWPLPATIKFGLIVFGTTAILLASYEHLVRYTWIGRFLNGTRTRPAAVAEPAVVPA